MQKYRALLTVDAEKFSSHRDADLPRLHMEIRHALITACAASGLAEAWASVRFLESTGDGLLAVLPDTAIPLLIDPLPRMLQEALAAVAPELRATGLRLRLRAALHAGLVDDEREEAPGISTATIDVCRLLDGRPLRQALAESDPNVTFVAFLLSEEVFRPYVAGGHAPLRESQFTEVQVSVKQYHRNAYLWVPVPSSAGAAVSRLEPVDPTPPPSAAEPLKGVTISGQGSRNVFGNTAGRDINTGWS
jgi:hypothetical protein